MSSQELPVDSPITRIEVENLEAQVLNQVPGEARHVPLTPEQVRTADAVFAQREQESKQVMGLIGLWTSTLLLHDIAVDTFDTKDEEEEKPRKKENPEL
jgi:hypothetical protein